MQLFEGESSGKLQKAGAFALTILGIYLIALAIGQFMELRYIGAGIHPTNVISIEGKGEVISIPDLALFTFSVVERAKTVAEAQEAATKKINAALEYLDDQGVEEKDIKTTGYNVYPQYEWQDIRCVSYPCPQGKNVLIGYEVRQSVEVKVRDTKEAGDLLSGVGERGASEVSGLTFTIDDEEGLKAKAREMAIEDAKKKVELLSKQLGVRVVRVVSFNENAGYPLPPIYYARDAAMGFGGVANESKSSPEIPSGENTITSFVTVTYEIR